jgi:hypothetical protein
VGIGFVPELLLITLSLTPEQAESSPAATLVFYLRKREGVSTVISGASVLSVSDAVLRLESGQMILGDNAAVNQSNVSYVWAGVG